MVVLIGVAIWRKVYTSCLQFDIQFWLSAVCLTFLLIFTVFMYDALQVQYFYINVIKFPGICLNIIYYIFITQS